LGVNTDRVRGPLLVAYYKRFLTNQDSSAFVAEVNRRYECATLERLVAIGEPMTRRAAVLAISCLGDYSSNAVLGRALVDRDRGVRTLADNGIRDLWCRAGTQRQQRALKAIVRFNRTQRYDDAVQAATRFLHSAPCIAEAWYQRGAAYYHLDHFHEAIRDCHEALEINPYHFTAAAGIGQCYLMLENPISALESFRRALRLNPGMEEVRVKVIQLQRTLKGE
jgi:tetratricopeptide (TPR) repeat protein